MSEDQPSLFTLDKESLLRRYRAEKRFRFYGISAIFLALFFLIFLLGSVVSEGYSAFYQSFIKIPVYFDPKIISLNGKMPKKVKDFIGINYSLLLRNALIEELHLSALTKGDLHQIKKIFSPEGALTLRKYLTKHPDFIGKTRSMEVLASSDVDSVFKGLVDLASGVKHKLSDKQLHWVSLLARRGLLYKKFNTAFFFNAASSRAESSGLGAALLGSFYMMGVVLLLAVPIGVGTAIYLEEYASKSKWMDILEININNLAAVPSIVFGLLGLTIFVNFFGLPRSASFVGGLVLSLMTLPTIVIATRSSLRAISPSIRAAALGLGASKTQLVFHHLLPLALPGIVTGTIIGIAQAFGQTAPLLLIGMVAFIADYPVTPLDPATALPVQIYIWASEMDRAFVARSSAAIIVLLLVLSILNGGAIFLRRCFERRR